MSNKDKILRYLSGLMNRDEKSEFEKQLNEPGSLKEEFEKIQNYLSSLNEFTNVNEDERYFNTILPRVRQKLEKRTDKFIPRLSIATAITAVILLIGILRIPDLSPANGSSDYRLTDFNTLISTIDSSALDELFENNFIQEYSAYYNEDFRSVIGNLSDETILDMNDYEYTSDLYYGNTSTELLNNMTEEEMEEVYQSLLNKEIL